MSRKKWTKSTSGKEWQEFLTKEIKQGSRIPPSIVILALQEWDTSNQFHKAFGDWLSTISQRKYVRVTHRLRARLASTVTKYRFSQLLNIYYLPNDIVKRVKPIGVTCFGRRILGKNICDKGSLGINVTVLGKSIVFVASHFPFDPARPHFNNKKNAAFRQTMKAMKLETGSFQNSPVVWLGDLNYRMGEHGLGKERKLVDDLRFNRTNQSLIFRGFLEGPVHTPPDELEDFHPTCKMIQWKDGKFSDWNKLKDARSIGADEAYHKDRRPSYCDRILVRPMMPSRLAIRSYKSSALGTNLSDHNAVFSSIEIRWDMPTTPMARGQYLRSRFAALQAEKRFQTESISRNDQPADILIETEIHRF